MGQEAEMQSSVTVRLDSSLLKRARARARQRGISLSALVEESLCATLAVTWPAPLNEEDLPPITRSLLGCLKGSRLDERDYRAYLEKKYR